MMTMVALVVLMAWVATVDLMALVALVAMATVAIDSVCLVGTSYGGFLVGEEIPFQLYLHLLQGLQLLWADVLGLHMACAVVSGGTLQHRISQVLPLGIDLLGTSGHSSPGGLLYG